MTGWDYFALIGVEFFTIGALGSAVINGWRFQGVWICLGCAAALLGLVLC